MRHMHSFKPSRHVPSSLTPPPESPASHTPYVDGFKPRTSWRLMLQREVFFVVQLIAIFSVSFTAMQISRNWLAASGFINSTASTQNARIFWPSNVLTIFPQPERLSLDTAAIASVTLGKTHISSERPAPQLTPSRSTQVAQHQVQVTRTRQYNKMRVQQATRNPYRWAPQRKAVPSNKLPAARVRQAQAPRIAAYTPPSTKALTKPKVTPASRPIRRILREDYQVPHPQQSYNSYMQWVRNTLQEYKPGS
ncbi:MAG: hypothetical protein ACO1RX_00330 [Candidatus Sericytochromatia bacterium]